MEDTEGISSDALIDELEKVTGRLETRIGAFKLTGKNIQGDIEKGFVFQPVHDLQDEEDATIGE
jgi:hypothetical protein